LSDGGWWMDNTNRGEENLAKWFAQIRWRRLLRLWVRVRVREVSTE